MQMQVSFSFTDPRLCAAFFGDLAPVLARFAVSDAAPVLRAAIPDGDDATSTGDGSHTDASPSGDQSPKRGRGRPPKQRDTVPADAPAQTQAAPAPAAPPVPSTVVIAPAPAIQAPAPAAPTQAPAAVDADAILNATSEPAAPEAPKLTKAAVQQRFVAAITAMEKRTPGTSKGVLAAVFDKYGAKGFGDLKETNYAAAVTEIESRAAAI